jgi:hypothetical protein
METYMHTDVARCGDNVKGPASWEPQEEGMMSIATSFSLSKKPRFVSPGKSQTPEGDACKPSDTPTRAPLTISC